MFFTYLGAAQVVDTQKSGIFSELSADILLLGEDRVVFVRKGGGHYAGIYYGDNSLLFCSYDSSRMQGFMTNGVRVRARPSFITIGVSAASIV